MFLRRLCTRPSFPLPDDPAREQGSRGSTMREIGAVPEPRLRGDDLIRGSLGYRCEQEADGAA